MEGIFEVILKVIGWVLGAFIVLVIGVAILYILVFGILWKLSGI